VPKESVLVIVNPIAGGGRAARLLPLLRAHAAAVEMEIAVTTHARQGEELAAAAAGRFERIVAVGGDGTVQELLNGVTASAERPAVGIVPAGSGNDLARALGLPGSARAALSVALHGEARPTDLAEARDGAGMRRLFGAAGGTGFDAHVAHLMTRRTAARRRGRLGYLLTALGELRRYRGAEVQLCWNDPDGAEERLQLRAFMVAVANGAYYGGGMRIAPTAALDDGALDLCIVADLPPLAALGQIPALYRGRHVRHSAVRMARATSVTLDGDAPVHLDGEPFGRLPLSVRVLPDEVRLAVGARQGA
jgi:YegS/Rv2252/BmrU family lipid kinase